MDTPNIEIVISCVQDQRFVAENLTRELHRLGITVFLDICDNSQMSAYESQVEICEGLHRANLIVLFCSADYFREAWTRSERGPTVKWIFETEAKPIFALQFDDFPLPLEFHETRRYQQGDAWEMAQIATELGNRFLQDIERTRQGIGRPPAHLSADTGEFKWLNFTQGEPLTFGLGDRSFESAWSSAGTDTIHIYNDGASIEGVALARGYTSIEQIVEASHLDFGGRSRTPRKNEIVVLKNTHGYYAAVQILSVSLISRGAEEDALRFRYVILADGSDNFSGTVFIDSIRVCGFRSLAKVQLSALKPIVVMIGANGSGKSNVLCLLEMLKSAVADRRLAVFIGRNGGADDQLFKGSKVTKCIDVEVTLRTSIGQLYDYRCVLNFGDDDRFFFETESYRFRVNRETETNWVDIEDSEGAREAALVSLGYSPGRETISSRIAANIVHTLSGIQVYHFRDTSRDSAFNKPCDLGDFARLYSDGSNLAAVLAYLEREHRGLYRRICDLISRGLPEFDHFILKPISGKVSLHWMRAGSTKPVGAHLTSDGSLRFFALVTLLNLPDEMLPTIVLLDEPELGIHPKSVELIGNLIKVLSIKKQVFVATQSPQLLDCFDLDEFLILEGGTDGTTVRALKSAEFSNWLDDGFLKSDLWQSNMLGGYP